MVLLVSIGNKNGGVSINVLNSIFSNISGLAMLIGSGYLIFKQFKSTSFEVSFTSIKEKYVLSIFLYLYMAILHLSIGSLSLAVTPKIPKWLGWTNIKWSVLCFAFIIISIITIAYLENKMSKRVEYLTRYKTIENEINYNKVSSKMFRNASLYTIMCMVIVFCSVSLFYFENSDNFNIAKLSALYTFDNLIIHINLGIVVLLAIVYNIGKLNML